MVWGDVVARKWFAFRIPLPLFTVSERKFRVLVGGRKVQFVHEDFVDFGSIYPLSITYVITH